jgi:hypothetical protein
VPRVPRADLFFARFRAKKSPLAITSLRTHGTPVQTAARRAGDTHRTNEHVVCGALRRRVIAGVHTFHVLQPKSFVFNAFSERTKTSSTVAASLSSASSAHRARVALRVDVACESALDARVHDAVFEVTGPLSVETFENCGESKVRVEPMVGLMS